MAAPTKALLFFAMINSLIACSSTDFKYRPVSGEDISTVRSEWDRRDLSAQDVVIEINEEDEFLIVRHTVEGKKHFGAIILPRSGPIDGAPVMVLLDGLNQEKPMINFDGYRNSGYVRFEKYSKFIKIIPSFRGRTAYYKDVSYHSDGDFCDAYDGAADDAISLVNAAESLFPEADYEDIFALGYSRGGTTALLMGIRDDRVNTIDASAAPVDFYRMSVRDNYGSQYQCQFMEGKTRKESRIRMLASSPVYFRPSSNVENIVIHYGQKDEIVPVWNAKNMADHLNRFDIKVKVYIYPDGTHDIYTDSTVTKDKIRAGLNMFIEGSK